MDKVTSDERLLKIIEGSVESRRKQNIGASPKKGLSGLIPRKLSFAFKFPETKLSLLAVNKGLAVAAGLLTLGFFYSLFSGPVVSASTAAYFSQADAGAVAKSIAAIQAQGLKREGMLTQDIKRDIFITAGTGGGGGLYASPENAGPKVSEIVKDLKLVGIIWSSSPEVMIENAKDSRTYSLKKGESFNSELFKVKEVSRNSATLEVFSNGGSSDYVLR